MTKPKKTVEQYREGEAAAELVRASLVSDQDPIITAAKIIAENFYSEAEEVIGLSGNHPATVADGLFAVARAITQAAQCDAQRTDHPLMGETLDGISNALMEISGSLSEIASAIKTKKE